MQCNAWYCSLNSVRPSVCHTRGLLQNYMMHCRYFDTTRKGNHSATLTQTAVGGRRSLSSEICAKSHPPSFENADFYRFPLRLFYYKGLANAKRTCGCSVLCLRPKSSLLSYSYGHASTIQLKADQYGHANRLTCKKKYN